MRVVITRPREDADGTAAELRARGHEPLIAPLVKIERMPFAVNGDWDAVAITSANAPRVMACSVHAEPLLRLPLYAVGAHSAAAAREAGFTDVESAEGDASDLVDLIVRRRKRGDRVLYLAGENRARNLGAEMEKQGIIATTAVVYRAVMLPCPANLAAALREGDIGAVLHFSRRGAEAYLAGADGMKEQALRPRHLCMSERAAAPLRAAGAADVRAAARPDEASLLDLLESR